ncbi:nitrate reductase associated protein [Phormidium tenue FACHB-886]|nr:nitrate reductase associated protein [Phormidium tenue FACHB-886]
MTELFEFEADFANSLRCIPMLVRYKLDTCGVKLKLHHWNQLSSAERQQVLVAPCESATEIQAYRSLLHQLVQSHLGEVPADLPVDDRPDWNNLAKIPESVQQQGEAVGTALSLEQWISLTPLQRFALIKLSRSNHENRNFLPALKEFHLTEP